MRRVLVTGATGFVGRHVVRELEGRGVAVVSGRRELGPDTEWGELLSGVDAVVHLAAAAHERAQVLERRRDYDALLRVNALGTERLARATAAAGVRRFVFMSTIGVHGDETFGNPFTEDDSPAPRSLYAASKLEAERRLAAVGRETGLCITVLRPTLVYGPGNPGNFRRLMDAIDRGWPLPLAAVRNRRSLTYVGNLVMAIAAVLGSESAEGTFIICDREAVSTPELVRRLAAFLGRPARLLRFPPSWLRLAGTALGARGTVRRLTGSLEADDTKLERTLGWRPPFTLAEGLEETVRSYRARREAPAAAGERASER